MSPRFDKFINGNYSNFISKYLGEKCPGLFEEYQECGSGCGDFYCGDDPNRICPMNCLLGCNCMTGYARSEEGVCIPIEQCPVEGNLKF